MITDGHARMDSNYVEKLTEQNLKLLTVLYGSSTADSVLSNWGPSIQLKNVVIE